MRPLLRPFAACLILCAAGCGNLPAVDAVEGADVDAAAFPELVPLDTLLDDAAPRVDDDLEARLTGRAEALRARADRLSATPVIAPENRARMQDGLARE